MNYDDIVRSAALLRGDPNFEVFLQAVEDSKDEMLGELSNFETIGNHANLAYIAGQIALCKRLLDIGGHDR